MPSGNHTKTPTSYFILAGLETGTLGGLMMLLFWASPVIYPYSLVVEKFHGSWLEQLYLANPVTLAVLAFQRGAWVRGGDQPFPDAMGLRLVVATAVCVVLLWLAQRIFARAEGNFAQEL